MTIHDQICELINKVNDKYNLLVELDSEGPTQSEYGECRPNEDYLGTGSFLIRLNLDMIFDRPEFLFNVLCHELGHCISMSKNGYPDSLTEAIDEETRADNYGVELWSEYYDSSAYFATSKDEERNAIRLKLYTEYFGGNNE